MGRAKALNEPCNDPYPPKLQQVWRAEWQQITDTAAILKDKADQWDAAQPTIEAMTAVAEAARGEHFRADHAGISDPWASHCRCGLSEHGCSVLQALDALDRIIGGANPQDHREGES